MWKKLRDILFITLAAWSLVAFGFAVWSAQKAQPPRQQQTATQHATENKGGENSKSLWQKTLEEPVAFFTFWLVVFSAVLATISIVQIRFLIRADVTARRSSAAARRSAIAARQTIRTMEDTAERQLRAYVDVSIFQATEIATAIDPSQMPLPLPGMAQLPPPRPGIYAQVILKNSGQTPAYNVFHTLGSAIAPATPNFVLTDQHLPPLNFGNAVRHGDEISRSAIAPDGTSAVTHWHPLPTPEERAEMASGNLGLYFYGGLYYEDVFRKQRHTFYRGIWRGVGPQVMQCAQGNEST